MTTHWSTSGNLNLEVPWSDIWKPQYLWGCNVLPGSHLHVLSHPCNWVTQEMGCWMDTSEPATWQLSNTKWQSGKSRENERRKVEGVGLYSPEMQYVTIFLMDSKATYEYFFFAYIKFAISIFVFECFLISIIIIMSNKYSNMLLFYTPLWHLKSAVSINWACQVAYFLRTHHYIHQSENKSARYSKPIFCAYLGYA